MFKIILVTMVLTGPGFDQKREVLGEVPATLVTEGLALCQQLKRQREFTEFSSGAVLRKCEHVAVTVRPE